jgi:hypothetical protein
MALARGADQRPERGAGRHGGVGRPDTARHVIHRTLIPRLMI